MAKLWDKGTPLNELVARFTVGRDWVLDRDLLVADCAGSVAHVRGLVAATLLAPEVGERLEASLRAIAAEARAGRVAIRREDEDGHTTIEMLLTERLGDAGRMVHTGRSRNDQVLTATRLWTREALLAIGESALELIDVLVTRAEQESATVMPGRTHLQHAMLSTFGLWLAAVAEHLIDDVRVLATAADLNDRSPLGSAAAYGTPLPVDREFLATQMGFPAVHNNVLAAGQSRGLTEMRIAEALAGVCLTLGRMAGDLLLFALPEVGYIGVPAELCTGSSIMPQKQNPDALELLRGRAAVVDGWAAQIRGVVRDLPSGYNRDLQDTKEPLMRAVAATEEGLAVARLLIERLEVRRDAMRRALTPELFATDFAYELVAAGVPFREAYRRAAIGYADRPVPDADVALAARTAIGSPGNLNLDVPRRAAAHLREEFGPARGAHEAAVLRTCSGQT